MNLITQPNLWSCSIAAAAMILDINIQTLIGIIGHDGSEIVFPKLQEPGNRRGFHIQEIIDCAIELGYFVTPIEILPYSTPDGKNEFPINFSEGNSHRLLKYVSKTKGILTGLGNKWYHAMAWDGKNIYDPNGYIYPFHDCKINLDCYWIFIEKEKEKRFNLLPQFKASQQGSV